MEPPCLQGPLDGGSVLSGGSGRSKGGIKERKGITCKVGTAQCACVTHSSVPDKFFSSSLKNVISCRYLSLALIIYDNYKTVLAIIIGLLFEF